MADAWAEIHGIASGEIEGYLGGLTAGLLLDNYDVVNHRLVVAAAEPFDATLEAGSAVMVDDDGIPRVRCLCGNPLLPALIESDGRTYSQEQFADAVEDYQISDSIEEVRAIAEAIVGAPDFDDATGVGALSLGETTGVACDRYVVALFVDNRVVDGPGPDLRIFEVGIKLERVHVSVRPEGSTEWVDLGEVEGATSEIDIGGVLSDSAAVDAVQLCDSGDGSTSAAYAAGADIDAVAAINSIAP